MKKEVKIKSLLKGYAVACIGLQLLCILILCFGVTSYYGKKVNVVEGVNLVLSIFSMGSSYYRGILGTILGITYVSCFALLIRDTIVTCKRANSLLKNSTEKDTTLVFELAQSTGNGIFRLLIFILACSVVRTSPFHFTAKLVVFFGITIFIASRALLYTLLRCTVRDLLWQTGYMVIFATSLVFFLGYAHKPIIEEFITELQSMFNLLNMDSSHFLSAACDLIIPVLYAVLLIIGLCYVYALFNDCVYYQKIKEQKNPLALVILCAILCGVVIISAISKGMGADIEQIFSLLNRYLPLLFAAIALYLSTGFPNKITTRKEKTEEVSLTTPVHPIAEAAITATETEEKRTPVQE